MFLIVCWPYNQCPEVQGIQEYIVERYHLCGVAALPLELLLILGYLIENSNIEGWSHVPGSVWTLSP